MQARQQLWHGEHRKMTTYILGAGPTGLAIADGIVDSKCGDFVLIERNHILGGLAQTVVWDSIGSHDLGPHKIFSKDESLVNRVENLLSEDEWLRRDKISSIYMNGYYLLYPPSPFSLANVFGLSTFVHMIIGYGLSILRSLFSNKQPKTFEEDLIGRLGTPLYDVLFKPIALKLWGDPQQLDVKLSQGRIQTPSIFEIIGRLLKIKKNSEFEALDFRYPKGGLGKLWDAIAEKSKGKGEIRTGKAVTGLKVENKRVTSIVLDGGDVIYVNKGDMVVSSLPLGLSLRLMGDAVPAPILQLSNDIIQLNDLLLVFLHVDCDSLLKESWVFVPDPNIAFHRLSEQESFDPKMTPSGGIVCCEIMSSKVRNFTSKTDESLVDDATQGLAVMGYKGFSVLNSKVVRLPKSYPVFRTGYKEGLIEILNFSDQFDNFRTLGRQGAFNYIGTLDAMDIGYGFAQWLQEGAQAHRWQKERKRTSSYPVLD